MTAKHRSEHANLPTPEAPAFDPFTLTAGTPGMHLPDAPMRPRGPKRHAAPPVQPRDEIPAGEVPDAANDDDRPLEWATHPTRRELRLAREAGIDIQRGLVGTLASRKWNTGSTGRGSMADEFGPFPAPTPDLKDFRTNWALSVVLGPLGVDRFHRGRHVTGALKLMTLGGAGIWWASDQFSIVTGKALDSGGHPMAGRFSHRLVAGGVSLAVIAGVGAAGVTAFAAHAEESGESLMAVIVPEQPEPVWEHLESLSGKQGVRASKPFTVTGNGVTFDYTLKGAGFVYLLPAGASSVPDGAEPLVTAFEAKSGTITQAPGPGEYVLFVQSPDAGWAVEIQQRVLR